MEVRHLLTCNWSIAGGCLGCLAVALAFFCRICIKLAFGGLRRAEGMAKDLRINRTCIVIVGSLGAVLLLWLLYYSRSGYVEETIKLSELLSVSIYLAEEGGNMSAVRSLADSEIRQISKGFTKEGASEYVTVGDQLSHEIITSGLKARWPNLRYQSEETDPRIIKTKLPPKENGEVMNVAFRDEEVPMSSVTVWIDPLDATQEYTEGKDNPELLQFVTVMVCIAVQGKPIAGVIHEPFTNDRSGKQGITKWGWVGHGVSRSVIESTSAVGRESGKLRVIASHSHAGTVFTTAENAFKDYEVDCSSRIRLQSFGCC